VSANANNVSGGVPSLARLAPVALKSAIKTSGIKRFIITPVVHDIDMMTQKAMLGSGKFFVKAPVRVLRA
jgi:hypothetical protein